ncbi:diguanylate cyclase (GGDEF) domain-containing protein [Klenkia soli]|uniref:Diguanylate cyclase (GGDEF) domain-containing protein n=1 Tax=Klenkia soli TaxID=1052260 RepID=A0A1H0NXB6_9ACTN|nr:GGDEF domain-containing protein [Klenkia soli]SDO97427.1 diguanylate cyclase (GGDEF) domain-containing protein [Klenkia soli]
MSPTTTRRPGAPGATSAARERLARRSRIAALWLTVASALVVPAWTVVDHVVEGPDVGRAFLGPRLLCAVPLLAVAWVVWRRTPGRRRTTTLTVAAVVPVEVMIGWMVPQVGHPELYVLGGTLMLYAAGAVLVGGAGWTAVLGAAVACGFPLGVLDAGRDPSLQEIVSWPLYLGTATLAAVVGHALRYRAVLAEMRWVTALEAEQEHTRQLVRDLERLSSEDPLTGLANRRRWDEALGAAPGGGSLAVLLVDVDHFKTINDTGGHPAGDHALQQVAAVLWGAVRAGDLVARLGGDEFGVLLRDVPAAEAREVAEAVRARVEGLVWEGLSAPVTLSVGLAAGEATDVQALARTADRLLYEAKGTRNAVACELAAL